ncbi:MAG: hypothetical protein AB7G11_06165 [Phycisphaerales bacterium]
MCILLPSTAWAQFKSAREWFDTQWRAAQSVADLGDWSLHWTEETWETPPPAELERMRRSTAGYAPQHPERPLVESFERRLRGIPDTFSRSLWARSPGRWRYCSLPNGGSYTDYAATGKEAWCLVPSTATVVPMSASVPAGRDYASMEPSVRRDLSLLLFGGLGVISHAAPKLAAFELGSDGASWTASATSAMGYSLRASGSWREGEGVGTIDRVEMREKDDTTLLEVIQARSPKPIGDTPWMVATEVEVTDHGRRTLRLFNIEAKLNDPAGFREATSAPRAGRHADAVRGSVDIANFSDYRVGTQTIASTTTEGDRVAVTRELLDATRGPSYLRYVGWIAGGLFVAGIAVVLRQRRMRASTKHYRSPR